MGGKRGLPCCLDEVFIPYPKTTRRPVFLPWGSFPGHIVTCDDPQITICLPPNVTSVCHLMLDMGVPQSLKVQYKSEMVMLLADLIEEWDAVRARKIRRGCGGLNDEGQAQMLDVTQILAEK